MQEWGDLFSHSAVALGQRGCCARMLEQTQLFDPKKAIWWSNLRNRMNVIIGQLRRLMLVSLKAAKSVLVQLVIL
jgi:hypothetical protein